MSTKKCIVVELKGALKEALEELHGELEGRPDVLEAMSCQDVARKLMIHSIREHMAGRGPWQK